MADAQTTQVVIEIVGTPATPIMVSQIVVEVVHGEGVEPPPASNRIILAQFI